MFLAPAPVKITPEMASAFDAKMKIAEAAEPARAAAMSALLQAEHDTNREKVRDGHHSMGGSPSVHTCTAAITTISTGLITWQRTAAGLVLVV